MDIKGKVAVITGGASGIGAALARRYAEQGAQAVVIANVKRELAQSLAAELGNVAQAFSCDVSEEIGVQKLAAFARERYGRIDVYCSNAGILGKPGGLETPDAIWERMWHLHGMAHVWAARAVIPEMEQRGEGFFLVTASAAGLLNIVESAPYGATKHAAVGIAEWLRIAHGKNGVRVACLCPQSVQTAMTGDATGSACLDGVLTADQVADEVLAAMHIGQFLIIPHPEVARYMTSKASDYERWLAAMQRLHSRFVTESPAGL